MWELGNLIPTGRIVAPPPDRDLSRGLALGDLEFDDVYTGVTALGAWEAVYADPAAGVELALRSEANLRELVVYTTRESGIVCLEPYSCATDAFNLEARGIPAGMTLLPPGAVWRTCVTFIPRPLA